MKSNRRSSRGTTFDVRRPNASLPSSTNRPLITQSHKPVSDPMMVHGAKKTKPPVEKNTPSYPAQTMAKDSPKILEHFIIEPEPNQDMVVMSATARKHRSATHKLLVVIITVVILVAVLVVVSLVIG